MEEENNVDKGVINVKPKNDKNILSLKKAVKVEVEQKTADSVLDQFSDFIDEEDEEKMQYTFPLQPAIINIGTWILFECPELFLEKSSNILLYLTCTLLILAAQTISAILYNQSSYKSLQSVALQIEGVQQNGTSKQVAGWI